MLNEPKSVKWSLKIYDFLQTGIQLVIRFLNLFKGTLGQNSDEASVRARMQNKKLEQEVVPHVASL